MADIISEPGKWPVPVLPCCWGCWVSVTRLTSWQSFAV